MASCVRMSSMAYWYLVLFAWSGIQTGFFRSAHFLCRDMVVVLWRQQSTYLIQDAICNIMLLLILCKVCTLWSHLVSTCFQSEFWLVSFGVCNCRFVHITVSTEPKLSNKSAQLGRKVHWNLVIGVLKFWLSISSAQLGRRGAEHWWWALQNFGFQSALLNGWDHGAEHWWWVFQKFWRFLFCGATCHFLFNCVHACGPRRYGMCNNWECICLWKNLSILDFWCSHIIWIYNTTKLWSTKPIIISVKQNKKFYLS